MADGLAYHPDTSAVVVRTLAYSSRPAEEAEYCCPHSLLGVTVVEMNGESVHVCLKCKAGYTSAKRLVAMHRVEEFGYQDPIAHSVKSSMPNDPPTESELFELRVLLREYPPEKSTEAKLAFLKKVKVGSGRASAA